MVDRKEDDAKYNSPEQMLARNTRLIRQPSGSTTAVRLNRGEREYLEWLAAERARKAV
jgi:hypothetical protein